MSITTGSSSVPPTIPPLPTIDLELVNTKLERLDAERIIDWSYQTFDHRLVMTTSFGIQSAVMLHLVTRVVPQIPVIFIDTGFHFPETYRYADELNERLSLNLDVRQASLSPAWMSARHGRLWEEGKKGIDRYDQIRKVEPMRNALSEHRAIAWLAGLRHDQTEHRAALKHLEIQDGCYKIHPILTWTGAHVDQYMHKHDLPFHPLREKGYTSIGDWHSTKPVGGDIDDRSGRFAGLKQECGLHLPMTEQEDASRMSSGL